MHRIAFLPVFLVALAVWLRPAPAIAQDEPDPDYGDPPKVWWTPLDDKKMGTWHYVVQVGTRKVGKLTLRLYRDLEQGNTLKLQEIEQRASAFGRTTFTRDYSYDRGTESGLMAHRFETQFGGYKYSSDWQLGNDASGQFKWQARIESGGRLFDYESPAPSISPSDPVLSGKTIRNPMMLPGSIRLLPRMMSDTPGYPRSILYMMIQEPRATMGAMELTFAYEREEELEIGARKIKCTVIAMKQQQDAIGEFWLTPKYELVKFTEKYAVNGNPILTQYLPATPEEASAAVEEAAKWGAATNAGAEGAALAWLKAIWNGKAEDAAKLVDQAAVDADLAALEPAQQERIKPLLDPAALAKALKENPSELLFRWAPVSRDDPKGGVSVMLPTLKGDLRVRVAKSMVGEGEKAVEVWKIVGINPPF